jgi:hypothetical protein
MKILPFHAPLGDELLAEEEATLAFSAEMTAWFAGGPTQVVRGRIFLSTTTLAFRCPEAMPHPQQVTVLLRDVQGVAVVRDRLFGVLPLPKRSLVVTVGVMGKPFELRFGVEDAEAWAARIERARPGAAPAPDLGALLDAALREGVRDRGRYVSTLQRVSFPRALWYTEEHAEIGAITRAELRALGASADLDEAFLAGLDLAVETTSGPEDYETGPGSEMAGRHEQVARILRAANAALPAQAPRRFHQFAEDLPDWDFSQPVWLYLTASQREGLLRLGIVAPFAPPRPDGA